MKTEEDNGNIVDIGVSVEDFTKNLVISDSDRKNKTK